MKVSEKEREEEMERRNQLRVVMKLMDKKRGERKLIIAF